MPRGLRHFAALIALLAASGLAPLAHIALEHGGHEAHELECACNEGAGSSEHLHVPERGHHEGPECELCRFLGAQRFLPAPDRLAFTDAAARMVAVPAARTPAVARLLREVLPRGPPTIA